MLRLHFSRMRRDIAKDVRTERVRRRRIKSEKPEDIIRRTMQEIRTGRRTGLSANLSLGSRGAVRAPEPST